MKKEPTVVENFIMDNIGYCDYINNFPTFSHQSVAVATRLLVSTTNVHIGHPDWSTRENEKM